MDRCEWAHTVAGPFSPFGDGFAFLRTPRSLAFGGWARLSAACVPKLGQSLVAEAFPTSFKVGPGLVAPDGGSPAVVGGARGGSQVGSSFGFGSPPLVMATTIRAALIATLLVSACSREQWGRIIVMPSLCFISGLSHGGGSPLVRHTRVVVSDAGWVLRLTDLALTGRRRDPGASLCWAFFAAWCRFVLPPWGLSCLSLR